MKKTWIIALSVVGVIAVAGGVAFFFWDDLSLLFGTDSKSVPAPAGEVSLVLDFEGGGNVSSAPPAEPAAVTSPPQATTDASINASDEGEESGEFSLDEDEGEQESLDPMPEPPPTSQPVPKKTDPTPTLSRKTEVQTATKQPAPKRPQPQSKPEPILESSSIRLQKNVQGLMAQKKYAEAERLMKAHLAENPADGDVHFLMGFLLVQQNRKAEAVPHFQNASRDAKVAHVRRMADQYLQKLR